jgi:hypothetical protein
MGNNLPLDYPQFFPANPAIWLENVHSLSQAILWEHVRPKFTIFGSAMAS